MKLYVWCFQDGLGYKPPFKAEFLGEENNRAKLRVNGRQIQAHRAACSTVPFRAGQEHTEPYAAEVRSKTQRAAPADSASRFAVGASKNNRRKMP